MEEKLKKYLITKYTRDEDFVVIDKNIFSKTGISMQTLLGINEITPVQAIFYISISSKPYNLGYRIGICLA